MVRAKRGEKLLLVDLLALVAGYIRDIGEAKRFLLEYFDRHHLDIDWDFDVEFEVVPTGGSRPPPPIDALAVELGFWLRNDEDSQIDVDWGASSAVRVGPLMWVDYEPHDPYDPGDPIGERYRVLFDLHYQVTLRVSLIRIDPEPIIAWLLLRGLTPPAAASSPSASQEKVQPLTAIPVTAGRGRQRGWAAGWILKACPNNTWRRMRTKTILQAIARVAAEMGETNYPDKESTVRSAKKQMLTRRN